MFRVRYKGCSPKGKKLVAFATPFQTPAGGQKYPLNLKPTFNRRHAPCALILNLCFAFALGMFFRVIFKTGSLEMGLTRGRIVQYSPSEPF